MNCENLDEARKRIDEIDAELLKLLNLRAECVIQIGRIKRQTNAEVLDSGREAVLLERLRELNTGPLSDETVNELFQTIIDTLKDFQT